ncbi:glycosyltransferase family 4 protein [Thiomicrorhabdus sp.]|uniref:glycosyltransferase family 4 protein n=1 Tax=Thiomicrorhabdus sp. TaxID=2039724 RepID=UPI0029C7A425|nr:glycosyltransferase family 4 protein [Thiomicrorhabdus sp.]
MSALPESRILLTARDPNMNTSNPIRKLLIIGYVWPEPNSSAAGSRMMQLIEQFLQAGIEVTFATAATDSPHAVDLEIAGVITAKINLNDSDFDHFLKQLMPDAVLFDRFMIEEQFGWRVENHCPGALRILNTEDLHCLRQTRHLMLKQLEKETYQLQYSETLDQDKLFRMLTKQEICKRELAAIHRCDINLMVSDFEIQLLQTYFNVPPRQLYYLPLVYSAKPPTHKSFSQRRHFIAIGNFRHQPNWDAVLQLKQHIWPQLSRKLPDAELHIYGAYPPPKATALHSNKERFLVKGWAQDAFETIESARVLLAPLRFGAGIKGKLAETMRCGTPSITTPIGAEAMQFSATWGGVIANNYSEFIEAASELYQHQNSWQRAQKNAFDLFDRHFSHPHSGFIKLVAALNDYRHNLTELRSQHFIGAMLNHHQHKSTQYMSQWIEAKNQLKDKNPQAH